MERVTLTFLETPGTKAPTLEGVGRVQVIRGKDGTPCGFAFPAPYADLALLDGRP